MTSIRMTTGATNAVHEAAAEGFARGAGAYERGRPSYPPEAVSWLAEQLGMVPGRRVLDLAAGTGKLTPLLVATGASRSRRNPSATTTSGRQAHQPRGHHPLGGVAITPPTLCL